MINHQDLSKHPKVREMIHHYKEDDAIVKRLAADAEDRYYIDPELYGKHEVKRGLRDANGKGVVAGLTNIGSVVATKKLEEPLYRQKGNCIIVAFPLKSWYRAF